MLRVSLSAYTVLVDNAVYDYTNPGITLISDSKMRNTADVQPVPMNPLTNKQILRHEDVRGG